MSGDDRVKAPESNEEGVRLARAQTYKLNRPGWEVTGDRRSDTIHIRAANAGPAVSYWVPEQPHILYRLDAATGELTGIDITELHDLLRRDAAWRRAATSMIWAGFVDSIPGLRWLLRGPIGAAKDLVREQTARLAPAQEHGSATAGA